MLPERLGPYKITSRLGRGGMGAVYGGVNAETQERAAVKALARELVHEDDFRQRFAAEIATLRRLNHPNIVRLFGFGEQDGQLFYAMEIVDGVSLEEEIKRGRRFDWREVARIGAETCLALRHAHDRGVIHRDIKPANLLLASDGMTKLSDFGIARLFGSTRMTMAGSVIGTVEYMAPEQADGRPIDHRADLYSLGGVLYALLAGRSPFVAKTLPEMLHKQRYAIPEPLGTMARGVPADLCDLIGKLLAKDPADRFPTALVLGRHLNEMLLADAARTTGVVSEPDSDTVDKIGDSHVHATDKANEADDVDFDLSPPAENQEYDPEAFLPTRDISQIGISDLAKSGSSDPAADDHLLPETRATTAFEAFLNPASSKDDPQSENSVNAAVTAEFTAESGASVVSKPAGPATGRQDVTAETVGRCRANESESHGESSERLGRVRTSNSIDNAITDEPIEADQANTTKGRFTVVPREELGRIHIHRDAPHALISPQTWVLAAALLTVGIGVWYALLPPSADALYERIVEKTANGKTASIVAAQDDIEEFLLNHSDDSRCKYLHKFEREIRLDAMQRKFNLRVKAFGNTEQLLPIERAYLEARNYAWLDPELGMKKMQALVDLYGYGTDIAGPTGQCLELARRQIEKLHEELEESNTDHLHMLDERLDHADRLAESDLEEAEAIWRATLELYAQKPWAAAAVQRAQAALEKYDAKLQQTDKSVTTAESRVTSLPREEKANTKTK